MVWIQGQEPLPVEAEERTSLSSGLCCWEAVQCHMILNVFMSLNFFFLLSFQTLLKTHSVS